MSTNKTQNYQLHAWGLADEPTLGEVNENFAKLDAALKAEENNRKSADAGAAQVVVGSYVGNNTSELFIQLGFTPSFVMVVNSSGMMGYVTNGMTVIYGGVALPGLSLASGLMEIATNGFIVRNKDSINSLIMNDSATRYYLAFR